MAGCVVVESSVLFADPPRPDKPIRRQSHTSGNGQSAFGARHQRPVSAAGSLQPACRGRRPLPHDSVLSLWSFSLDALSSFAKRGIVPLLPLLLRDCPLFRGSFVSKKGQGIWQGRVMAVKAGKKWVWRDIRGREAQLAARVLNGLQVFILRASSAGISSEICGTVAAGRGICFFGHKAISSGRATAS